MGVTENATLNVRREEGGKIRVTSNLWDSAKVIGKGEVLEVRNVDGRLHVAWTPEPDVVRTEDSLCNDWRAIR